MAKQTANKDDDASKKQVAKAANTAVSTEVDYGTDAGKGYEGQTSADLQIPFLAVLQPTSPEIDDPENGGIEGAKAGMILNTATKELVNGKDGLIFVPACRQHLFLEWVPRDKGGGLVGVHEPNSDIVTKAKERAAKEGADFGKYKTEAGNDLVETFYLYGVMEDTGMTVVLPFTSTKIAVYKQWNTKLNYFMIQTKDGRKQKPPLYAHRVKLTTIKEKNSKGEFYNFVLSAAEGDLMASLVPPADPRFEAAKNVGEMVNSGQAKVSHEALAKEDKAAPAEGGKAPF